MKRAAALATVLTALAAAGPADAARKAGPVRYVDCTAERGGDGRTKARPITTLERANVVRLRAGARLLLRRGTVCKGTLAPRGSGKPGRRAIVGAYGRGPRPRVEGTGTDGVVLRDTAHIVLQDLEVTNRGPEARRRGVWVVATAGVLRDVTVRRMYIHDVDGDLDKGTGGSGGILADAAGKPPTRFDGLLIADNRIERVSRSGISIGGTQDPTRPSVDEPWPEASTDVVVRGNRIHQIGGDGIVPRGTVGALIDRNVVSDGNLRGHNVFDLLNYVCNAGIWAFHANGTIIQRNEVHHMRFNGCDGTGYDIDYNQDGTVVQFNYSHHNGGGFILLCGDEGRPRRAEVRFNLSVDDAATINEAPCRLAEGILGNLDGVRFYNNTIVAPRPRLVAEHVPLPLIANPASFEFRNNVIAATSDRLESLPCGMRCTHNLFHRLPPSGTSAVRGDPLFADPGFRGTGIDDALRAFRLRPGSPAIGAGTPMRYGPDRDALGTRLPASGRPSLGMHQPAG